MAAFTVELARRKALVRWRTTSKHHKIQQAARDRVFADYRLRIGQLVSDTHVPEGQALTEQRLDVTQAGAGKAVTLLNAMRAPDWIAQASAQSVAESLGLDTQAQGLVAWDAFNALLSPGDAIVVATWRDQAAADAFERDAAQLNDVRLRHIRVIREYGMFDRREAPQYFPDVERKANAVARYPHWQKSRTKWPNNRPLFASASEALFLEFP